MENRGRIYAITSTAVVLIALLFILIVFVLWYMFGYNYVVAPSASTSMEAAVPSAAAALTVFSI